MMRNLVMTPSQARETIERLSQSALLVNDHGITPDSLIEEYNEALLAFVPRGQLHAWHISMSYQVVDRSLAVADRPPTRAFVQGGVFRHLVGGAQMDFNKLLAMKRHQDRAKQH